MFEFDNIQKDETTPTITLKSPWIFKAGGTGGLIIPIGTTAQREAQQGVIRYNTTTSKFEGYDGAAWRDFH